MKKIVIVISIAALAACGTVKVAQPTQADADFGATKFAGYTLAQLNKDKEMYEQNCSTCHNLKNPRSKKESQWKEIVPEMAMKAKKKAHGSEVINTGTQENILRYLTVMSKK